MVKRHSDYERDRPQPTPVPTDGCERGGPNPTTEEDPGGWARLAIVVLGPPIAWAAGYAANTYTAAGLPVTSWFGVYVGGPLWGAVLLGGMALGAATALALVVVVVGGSVGWVREGFERDAKRAALRSPDHPAAGQLSAPEAGGELSMPEAEPARLRR